MNMCSAGIDQAELEQSFVKAFEFEPLDCCCVFNYCEVYVVLQMQSEISSTVRAVCASQHNNEELAGKKGSSINQTIEETLPAEG